MKLDLTFTVHAIGSSHVQSAVDLEITFEFCFSKLTGYLFHLSL